MSTPDPTERPPRVVGILVFDDVEVLDFAGPFEVFAVTGQQTTPPAFRVGTVGLDHQPVTARGGLRILPDQSLDEARWPDILVVPGGPGSRRLLDDDRLMNWLRESAVHTELTLSVCTGALLLAKAGLLDGLPATTHHDGMGELQALSPSTTVVVGERFVQSAPLLWTSAGVSAGIDLSLHIVEALLGPVTAGETRTEMEWGEWESTTTVS